MKKLFLILSAAVALSSVAFADDGGSYNTENAEIDVVELYSVEDIVINELLRSDDPENHAVAWEYLKYRAEEYGLPPTEENLSRLAQAVLDQFKHSETETQSEANGTEEQKKAAVAVIFYAGTECSNDGRERLLGVGLAQNHSGLEWCIKNANAYSKSIATIQCSVDGDSDAYTFTGDLDGSDNLGQIGAFLRKNGITDDTVGGSLYPAFYCAKNYAEWEGSNAWGTKFESGWYLPSIAELFQVWKNVETVNAAIEACGGTPFDEKYYWSSSQYASPYYNIAYLFDFSIGWWGSSYKHIINFYVCAVRAFN
ncbi:MAG: hypothetical protein II921_04775 [Treponema sp.]|nr:hypothetical protein [Treponema sp.]